MSLELSYPAFYAEITCQTSPHPKKRFNVEVARVQLANTPFQVVGSFYSNEPTTDISFLKIREIELLCGYPKYDIKKHQNESRYFISFRGRAFDGADEFLAYTKGEIERANRVISAVLPPHAAPINVENAVYVADSENQMRTIIEDREIGTTIRFAVVDDVDVINRWNDHMTDIVERRSESLFYFLERESDDAVLGKCIALVAENTYSSFYNAFEILREFYGGHHKFIRMQGIDRDEVSIFTDNAQVYRHAIHRLNKREMPLAEAKLFILKLLKFYIKTPHRVRR